MARTAVPITALVANTGILAVAGTAVDPTNGHSIAAGGDTGKLWLDVKNTAGGAKNVTIKAGPGPYPAWQAGAGDYVVSVAATTGNRLIGPLESARFIQADGSIWVDIEAATTGTIACYRLPTA